MWTSLGGLSFYLSQACNPNFLYQRTRLLYSSLVLKFFSCHVSSDLSSVAQSCPTLSDPMDCSTPGFPVHHQPPELAQTHAHQVGDAIQASRPL